MKNEILQFKRLNTIRFLTVKKSTVCTREAGSHFSPGGRAASTKPACEPASCTPNLRGAASGLAAICALLTRAMSGLIGTQKQKRGEEYVWLRRTRTYYHFLNCT